MRLGSSCEVIFLVKRQRQRQRQRAKPVTTQVKERAASLLSLPPLSHLRVEDLLAVPVQQRHERRLDELGVAVILLLGDLEAGVGEEVAVDLLKAGGDLLPGLSQVLGVPVLDDALQRARRLFAE